MEYGNSISALAIYLDSLGYVLEVCLSIRFLEHVGTHKSYLFWNLLGYTQTESNEDFRFERSGNDLVGSYCITICICLIETLA